MKGPKILAVTFAAALGLVLAMPAAWARPKNTKYQPSSALDSGNSPMTGIYEVPGGCCWGGAILKYNEPIKFSFNRPIRIPGRVLPAGSYWFVMQDTATGNTVSVLDADQNVISTMATADAETVQYYSNSPLVTVAEGAPGQPDAIVAWFLPGMNLGHQFVYSKSERKALEEEPTMTVHVQWGGNYAKG